jgi:hypothetical protein
MQVRQQEKYIVWLKKFQNDILKKILLRRQHIGST